jgi:hypothetical protein
VNDAPTLAELGVDKKWASRARTLAKIPEVDQERITKELSQDGEDITPTNIIKRWKQKQREEKRETYSRKVGLGALSRT